MNNLDLFQRKEAVINRIVYRACGDPRLNRDLDIEQKLKGVKACVRWSKTLLDDNSENKVASVTSDFLDEIEKLAALSAITLDLDKRSREWFVNYLWQLDPKRSLMIDDQWEQSQSDSIYYLFLLDTKELYEAIVQLHHMVLSLSHRDISLIYFYLQHTIFFCISILISYSVEKDLIEWI